MRKPLRTIVVSALLAVPLLPAAAGAGDSERELAEALAAQLTLVAKEGKKFSASMDALAKSRLRVAQSLEENLVATREGNELDLRVWKAIGATHRWKLFEEVIAATGAAVAQELEKKNRRERQKRELEELKSAVDFRGKALIEAAKELSALAEPQAQAIPLSFVQQVVAGIEKDTKAGSGKAGIGEFLSLASLAKTELDGLREQKSSVDRKGE